MKLFKVQSTFPRLVKPVTDTLLELTNTQSVTDLTKRLKKCGIGVDTGKMSQSL